MNNTVRYNPFEWKCDPEQIENCYDLAVSKLRAMFPEYKVDSCDMFVLYTLDSEGNTLTYFTTGTTSEGEYAMQNTDTKEVYVLSDVW